jgi:Uma2 family endonuclease
MVIVEEEKKLLTIAEYLAAEDAAETRHEFQNGNTIAMAGGTLAHNAVKLRIAGKLDQYVEAQNLPHMVLNSDTKVRIEAFNRFLYPDVTISAGTPEYYTTPEGKTRRDIIINPLVIVEVLSEETRDYDKGGKFEFYSSIPGFQEYLLIEPEEAWVRSIFLQDPQENLWKHEIFTGKEAKLPIRSLGLELPLAEIYAVLEKLPKGSA